MKELIDVRANITLLPGKELRPRVELILLASEVFYETPRTPDAEGKFPITALRRAEAIRISATPDQLRTVAEICQQVALEAEEAAAMFELVDLPPETTETTTAPVPAKP